MPAPADRMRRAWAPGRLLVAPLALAGCEPGSIPAGGTLFRDSAGVVVVENDHTRPTLGEGGLHVGESPLVRIGSLDARGPAQLHMVRHSTFLPDGGIAVVDGQTAEVRIFDGEGHHLRSLGGEGEGPGEFRSPWQVHSMPADSLLVIDLYRAVSVFDAEGRYVRRFVPGGTSGEAQGAPLGVFGDGSLLFMKYQPSDPSRTGVYRTRVELVRIDLEGEQVRSFGLFDHQTGRSGPGSYVFGPRASMVPGPDGVLYAPGDRFEVRRIDLEGRTTRLVRLDAEPAPVTQAHRDAWVDMLVRSNPDTPEERIRQIMGEIESPPRFPPHGEMVLGDRRELWVREYRIPGDEGPARWYVFDEAGRYLGAVFTPAGFTLHRVRNDRILGRWEDDLGVEYVTVYRIERGSP